MTEATSTVSVTEVTSTAWVTEATLTPWVTEATLTSLPDDVDAYGRAHRGQHAADHDVVLHDEGDGQETHGQTAVAVPPEEGGQQAEPDHGHEMRVFETCNSSRVAVT